MQNASFNSLNFVLRPLLFVVATPVLVSRLGADDYGLWVLALTISGLSGVMAFGLGDATVKFVSKYRAQADTAAIVRVVRSTYALYVALGLITWLLVHLLAPILVARVFNIPPEQQQLATAAVRIAGAGIVVRFIHSVFESALFGFERYDVAAAVSAVASTLTVGASVGLVLQGYGVLALMVASIVISVVDSIAKATLLKAMLLPELVPLPLVSRDAVKEILGYGVFSWLQGVGSILLNQLDKLIVVSFLGAAGLAYYSVCLQLGFFVHGLGARAVSFLFPMSSVMYERGDSQGLRRLYFYGQAASSVIAAGLSLPLLVFAPQVLTLWMGAEFAAAAGDTLRILSVAFALMATSTVPYYFMNGTSFVRMNTAFALSSGLVVALAAFLLVPAAGMIGAALARLANIPVALIARTILHRQVLSDDRWYGGIATLLPVAVGLTPALLLLAPGASAGLIVRWWPVLAVALAMTAAALAWATARLIGGLAGAGEPLVSTALAGGRREAST